MKRLPEVGEWVTYRPHPSAQAEDGEVVAVNRESGLALVRYRGDTIAKATYFRDLEPGINHAE